MSALIPNLAEDEPVSHEDCGVVGIPGQSGGSAGVGVEDRGVGVVVDADLVVWVMVSHNCSVTTRTRICLTSTIQSNYFQHK